MSVKIFGATGQFPRGKASADDEGELQMGVAADFANAIVRLQFGKPVAWLGFYAEFRVDADYLKKHNPQEGGYYVVYKDGYKSFSPAAAFEEGYTRV